MTPAELRDQVKAIADPLVATGATPAEINEVLRGQLWLMIGGGGKGPDESIPRCAYCGACGGGGHGGFCPNGSYW